MAKANLVLFETVDKKIIELRSQQVILDSDLAQLYGVETREINQAVKNNPDKFPTGYIFELTAKEWEPVKSKFLTSPLGGGKVKLPKAFTEQGLYMLATILKGKRATQTTLAIVETYARIKHLARNIKGLSDTQDEEKKNSLMKNSGQLIAEILEDDLKIDASETSIELNFAVLKFKHTIKKKKK
jgi:hypothetical protein